MQTLRINSTGADVRRLQELLNSRGFNLTVDGIFGILTETAVREFQREGDLTTDGIVGQQTWRALGVVDNSKFKIQNSKLDEPTTAGVVRYSLASDGESQLTPNFKIKEFASKCGADDIFIDVDFIKNVFQKIREHFKTPITITSGYRTDQHNINIRADKRQTNSNHRYNEQIARQTNNNQCNGSAIDFSVRGVSVIEVCRYCESIGVKCIIQYPGWTHIDNRNSRFFSRNSGQSATNSFN